MTRDIVSPPPSTDGDEKLTKDLADAPGALMNVNLKRTANNITSHGRTHMVVELIDNASIAEGFLAYKSGVRLRGDLHLWPSLKPMPTRIVRAESPFNQTTLREVLISAN